jgi:hypothetical protein
VPRGSFRELIATDSLQDNNGYLPAVSDPDPGYAEPFGRMGLRIRFYRTIFQSECAFQSSNTLSFALCRFIT